MSEDQKNLDDILRSFMLRNPSVIAGVLLSLNGKVIASVISQDIGRSEIEPIISLIQTFITRVKEKLGVAFLHQIMIECKEFKIQMHSIGLNSIFIIIMKESLKILTVVKLFGDLTGELSKIEDQQGPVELIVENKFRINNLLNQKKNLKVIVFALLTKKSTQIHYLLKELNEKLIHYMIVAFQESSIGIIKDLGLNFKRISIISEETEIITSLTKEHDFFLAITKSGVSLGLVFLFMNTSHNFANLDKLTSASNKLISKMEEENTNRLTLKRKFLQEMFNEDTVILSASGKEIPSLNKIFEIYLGFKGIEVQYNGQFIIFSYGINMII